VFGERSGERGPDGEKGGPVVESKLLHKEKKRKGENTSEPWKGGGERSKTRGVEEAQTFSHETGEKGETRFKGKIRTSGLMHDSQDIRLRVVSAGGGKLGGVMNGAIRIGEGGNVGGGRSNEVRKKEAIELKRTRSLSGKVGF